MRKRYSYYADGGTTEDKEVSEERYYDMLDAVPPIYFNTLEGRGVRGGFAVGEVYSHEKVDGRIKPIYMAFYQVGDKYYEIEGMVYFNDKNSVKRYMSSRASGGDISNDIVGKFVYTDARNYPIFLYLKFIDDRWKDIMPGDVVDVTDYFNIDREKWKQIIKGDKWNDKIDNYKVEFIDSRYRKPNDVLSNEERPSFNYVDSDDFMKHGGMVKYFLVKYSNQPSILIKASSKDEAWKKYSDSMKPAFGNLRKSRAIITQEMADGGIMSTGGDGNIEYVVEYEVFVDDADDPYTERRSKTFKDMDEAIKFAERVYAPVKYEIIKNGEVVDYGYVDTKNKRLSKYADGGMMAKGGITEKEKLTKELMRLQRELNSTRLSTYMEGDTSEAEMARQREREVKLKRFNEILEILRESEKMADGGRMAKGGGVSKFKKVRTLAEAKLDPRVDDIYYEADDFREKTGSYWIYLKDGYIAKSMGGSSIIHEKTLKQVLDLLNNDVVETHGGMMAKGGATEHGLLEGDTIVETKNNLILIQSMPSREYFLLDIETGMRKPTRVSEWIKLSEGGNITKRRRL